MKRLFFIIIGIFFVLPAIALENIEYKNIGNEEKIALINGVWSAKLNRKTENYFVKRMSEGVLRFSEFYSPDGTFLFSTGTEYEFIEKGRLIGYSNSDLKFYEYTILNGILEQRELTYEEVQELFPEYKIIKISDFKSATNSLKIKKEKRHLKMILLNDTDMFFNNYCFTTNNSKYEKYWLLGFLDISKKGMIQFSRFGENTKNSPWFILLVR